MHQARFASLVEIVIPATDNIRIDNIRNSMIEADRRSVFTRRKAREQVLADVVSRCSRPDVVAWETLPRFLDDLKEYRSEVHRLAEQTTSLVPAEDLRARTTDLKHERARIVAMVDTTRKVVDSAQAGDA